MIVLNQISSNIYISLKLLLHIGSILKHVLQISLIVYIPLLIRISHLHQLLDRLVVDFAVGHSLEGDWAEVPERLRVENTEHVDEVVDQLLVVDLLHHVF